MNSPSITINRDTTYLAPNNERISNKNTHIRSYSNNTSYMRSNGDESRLVIDKSVPFREYGDYNKSTITNMTGNDKTSTYGEIKKERKLDYELRLRDDNIRKLEAENADLKKEVHRLRKIEAGWTMGGKNQVLEETRIHNTYIIEQNNNLKVEIEEYKAKYLELENIIQNIEEEKRELEMRYLSEHKER